MVDDDEWLSTHEQRLCIDTADGEERLSTHTTVDGRTTAQLDTVDGVPRLSSPELTTNNEPAHTVAVDEQLSLSLC